MTWCLQRLCRTGFLRRDKADSADADQEVPSGLLFQGEDMIEQLTEAHRS